MVQPRTGEVEAMTRALALAATPGVPLGPNPRVGAVLLGRRGEVLGEGYHRGAGHPHAEVEALRAATGSGGAAAVLPAGTTLVVTLEPCNHHGRTAPCVDAVLAAGVSRVVYATADPNPVAAGGAERLRQARVEVLDGVLAAEAATVNRAWSFGLAHGRPLVTWKFASTLDGRSAALDGSSRWISSPAARRDTHRLRGQCDVMLIGTNTVAVDDPALTVRDADDRPLDHQPLRAVMGLRDLSTDRRIFDAAAPTLRLRTRDPAAALAELFDAGRRHVFCEGGPTLAAAFWRAGLVDEVVCYVAPTLLGSGRAAVADLGVGSIAEAHRLRLQVADVVGDGDDANLRLVMTPTPATPRKD